MSEKLKVMTLEKLKLFTQDKACDQEYVGDGFRRNKDSTLVFTELFKALYFELVT